MKKKIIWTLAIFTVFILTACNKNQPSNEAPEMLEVKLSVNPEKGEVNQPIIFEAKVTQGNENVEDAKSVKFEIWRAHAQEHEKIDVKHAEDGIYRLDKTFQEEGTYYIISHVTARDMHNMPKEEFVIGSPSEPEAQSDAKDSMEDMDMEGH